MTNKDIKIRHAIITSVQTSERMYSISINKTGISIVHRKGKRKTQSLMKWEDIDNDFTKHYEKGKEENETTESSEEQTQDNADEESANSR